VRLALQDFDFVVAVRHGRAYRGTVARREDVVRRDHLAAGEIAVEYLVGERQTLAFLVTRRSVRVRTLSIGARRLHAIVQRLVRAVRERDLRWADASRAAYDAILRPLAPDLAPFQHICIIPDEDLWSVPFDVLRDRRGVGLIEKATVWYAPSLLMLRDTRRARPGSAERLLLAMANPAINAGTTSLVRSIDRDLSLGALPDAEREVERLRDLYGAANCDVHVGAAARETLFKAEAGRYRILHIATHGMVDDHSPMYSCLVLGPDERDDGLLEMREIVGLDLHADLAVLSSCDTARGRISRGEGVVGMAWAFLAAGCPTTVVSQWKVDSAATERLMIDFHLNLIRGHFQAKPDALRRAKLALMKNPRYRHPFYWAPFIVVGKP
jgi:CHAT domain-containing protein